MAEFKNADVLPENLSQAIYTIDGDRVHFAIRDGIPCYLVMYVDGKVVEDVGGPMLRTCGVVEEMVQQLLEIKNQAKNQNRKVRLDTTKSYMGKHILSASIDENYNTIAIMRKVLELKAENEKLKSTLSDAGLITP